MFDLAAFMRLALPHSGVPRQLSWWQVKGDGNYAALGRGNLNPPQWIDLISRMGPGMVVFASASLTPPTCVGDLDETCLMVTQDGLCAVRRKPMSLAYGAVGETADTVWGMLHGR